MSYTQQDRLIAIETPLGEDVLLLQGFTGREGISRLFSFHLDLASEKDNLSFTNIVGQSVTIRITQPDNTPRYLNGCVSRFAQSGVESGLFRYQMEVVPWLWFLTRIADCRIFQEKTIPKIIEEVFQSRGYNDYKFFLTATYDPREYCVQYRETDFNFVSRLMEQYGLFYFFEHSNGKHNLVIADSKSVHQPCPKQSTAYYGLHSGSVAGEDVVTAWQAEQEIRTGKYSLNDYNFETSTSSLLASEPTVYSVGGNSKFEIYDYPGEYLTQSQGRALSGVRMQEEEATHWVVTGASVCRGFASGHTFTLADHFRNDQNASYLLTELEHVASVGNSYSTGDKGTGEHYSNHFTCISSDVPFRPARVTPKPVVQGPQTALVVGKSGEEIWVDKYGRIKVQFYWDRQGAKDEKSSCWIRVSQPWAGNAWGGMWIPRMGQEVVVDFIEGDPDRPIITGRVYNNVQTVPYDLPEYQTRSTMKSRSTKNGSDDNYNELRFEDKKGSEQIFVNAERDMDLRVEHDSREFVGNDRHLVVQQNQLEQVGGYKYGQIQGERRDQVQGNVSMTVQGVKKESIAGNTSIACNSDHAETVGGDWSLQVSGQRNETVGSVYVVDSGSEIHLKGGQKVIIEAGLQLTIIGAGGFVDIGPAGVTIQGTMVNINSGGSAGTGTPVNPKNPDAPDLPAKPDTADDGSKGGKM